MQILLNGEVRNIVKNDDHNKAYVTIYIDSKDHVNIPCTCLSHIPSKTTANGRAFKAGGGTLKYI